MIQRIQSLFLLIAAILMGVTVFSPLLEISDGGKFLSSFCPFGIASPKLDFPTWGVLTFAVLSAILPLINIFLYKKRKLQANLGYITALCIVIFYVAAIVYLRAYLGRLEVDYTLNVQYGIILPAIALIFNILAIAKIKKDDKLVKSLDRIR